MKKTEWLLVLLIGMLTACNLVKPTDASRDVRLATYDQVEQCKKLGKATVSVLDKLGFMARSEEKIEEELRILAGNSATEMGGDTIVAAGPVSEGERPFDVYHCGR